MSSGQTTWLLRLFSTKREYVRSTTIGAKESNRAYSKHHLLSFNFHQVFAGDVGRTGSTRRPTVRTPEPLSVQFPKLGVLHNVAKRRKRWEYTRFSAVNYDTWNTDIDLPRNVKLNGEMPPKCITKGKVSQWNHQVLLWGWLLRFNGTSRAPKPAIQILAFQSGLIKCCSIVVSVGDRHTSSMIEVPAI